MRGSLPTMIALVVLTLSHALSAESPRLLVMPVHAATDEVARAAHDDVTITVRRLNRFRMPSTEERDDVLARAADSGLTCDARTADCATRIGVFGGFDFVLVTTIDETVHPTAKVALHSCTDGREVRAAEALLSRSAAVRAAGMQKLTARALGESVPLTGTLVITGPDRAAVDVDGAPKGTAPLTLVVQSGVHDVVVRSIAGTELRARVMVALDDTVRVDDALVSPREPSVTRDDAAMHIGGLPLGFVAGAGLVGMGLASAAGAALGAWLIAPDVSARSSMTARAYNDAVLLGRVLLGASAVGLVAAALGISILAVSAVGLE